MSQANFRMVVFSKTLRCVNNKNRYYYRNDCQSCLGIIANLSCVITLLHTKCLHVFKQETLKISNIQPEFRGPYICTATNDIGEDYRTINVNMDCKL